MRGWKLSIRVRNAKPDHHLFNNHGTWWCHFWAIADGFYQKRFRINLHTRSLPVARLLRDTVLANEWSEIISSEKRGIDHA